MSDTGATQVVSIGIGDDRLAAVIRLGRKHKRYLGFLPDAGFRDRALNDTLLAASDGESVLGYVLFDLRGDRVKIVHLCVDEAAQGRGIARLLINTVSEHYRDCSGLELACRRDYPADQLWPKLGFTPRNDKVGRSHAGHPLTIWVRGHGLPDLFSSPHVLETAAIDRNILQDLVTNRPQGEESRLLDRADWTHDLVELCATQELWMEVRGCDDPTVKDLMRARADLMRNLSNPGDRWSDLVEDVAARIPGAGQADHRHVAQSIAAGADYFVSRDSGVLEGRKALEDSFSIVVLRPEELLVQLDRSSSGTRYEPSALAATELTVSHGDDVSESEFVVAFLNTARGERKADLLKLLRQLRAKPRGVDFRLIRDSKRRALGCLCIQLTATGVEVPLLRVRSSGQLERALARQLAFIPREEAAKSTRPEVTIHDTWVPNPAEQALAEEGYVRNEEGGWSCDVRPGVVDAEDISPWSALNWEMDQWPGRVIGSGLKTYLVPISVAWAEALFDTGLAASSLLHRPLGLGLSREHVYFKNPRGSGGISPPARILWYVKGGTVGQPDGHIRAVSCLTHVQTGPPDELYGRYRRLGAWTKQQVVEAADRGEVMALRFTATEVFAKPLHLADIRSHYAASRVTPFFRSPSPIPEHLFRRLYEAASSYA